MDRSDRKKGDFSARPNRDGTNNYVLYPSSGTNIFRRIGIRIGQSFRPLIISERIRADILGNLGRSGAFFAKADIRRRQRGRTECAYITLHLEIIRILSAYTHHVVPVLQIHFRALQEANLNSSNQIP